MGDICCKLFPLQAVKLTGYFATTCNLKIFARPYYFWAKCPVGLLENFLHIPRKTGIWIF